MRYNDETPLRTVITGIDGAGKSTTAGIIAEQMGKEFKLVKTGRPVYTMVDGDKQYHYQRVIELIDKMHCIADKSKKPNFIGGVNAINVLLNTRIIEPLLIRRFQPDLVLGTRDFHIDPAVYSIVYQPYLAKKSMSERIDFMETVTGTPYRNMVFFLTVPAEEAVSRIERRIAKERANPGTSEREKWRHLHENSQTLTRLQGEYYDALKTIQTKAPIIIYEINTFGIPHMQVADLISETIREHIDNASLRNEASDWIKFEREPNTTQLQRTRVVFNNV